MEDPIRARRVVADRGDAGRRLDLVLRRRLADVAGATRTRVQAWIAGGAVTVNGRAIRRAAARVAAGDAVVVHLPETPARRTMAPEDLPLAVLYEDEHLVAIDKPPGMVVHPTYRHLESTVMNALLWRARAWGAASRPSIVGRLDKLTSGIVIAAKSRRVHAALQRALAAPGAVKQYLALVHGRPPRRGTIDLRLRRDPRDRRVVVASRTEGAASVTRFICLGRTADPLARLALLDCRIATGRMHQIRVHLAASGWPIVGDPKYGEPGRREAADPALAAALSAFPRQALHAWRLALPHPATGRRLVVEAPLPADLRALLSAAGLVQCAR